MCFIVNGAAECVEYDDSTAKIYNTLAECERDAEYRFYGLTDVLARYDMPYEKIVIGCTDSED